MVIGSSLAPSSTSGEVNISVGGAAIHRCRLVHAGPQLRHLARDGGPPLRRVPGLRLAGISDFEKVARLPEHTRSAPTSIRAPAFPQVRTYPHYGSFSSCERRA
jgi:hypothetical protein